MTEEAQAQGDAAPAGDAAPQGTAITNADATQNDGGDNTPASNESASDDKSQQTDGDSNDGNQDEQTSDTPTEYSEFSLPEGLEGNEEVMGEFNTLLNDVEKEIGKALPQDTAQKFVDMGANLVQQGVEQAMQHAAEYHAQRTEEWINTFKEDPEIGGTEEKQQQTLSTAKKVLSALGGDALLKAIDETGAGNNPEVIRAFYKLKDVVGEDGSLIIANSGGGQASLAQTLYPNQQT